DGRGAADAMGATTGQPRCFGATRGGAGRVVLTVGAGGASESSSATTCFDPAVRAPRASPPRAGRDAHDDAAPDAPSAIAAIARAIPSALPRLRGRAGAHASVGARAHVGRSSCVGPAAWSAHASSSAERYLFAGSFSIARAMTRQSARGTPGGAGGV